MRDRGSQEFSCLLLKPYKTVVHLRVSVLCYVTGRDLTDYLPSYTEQANLAFALAFCWLLCHVVFAICCFVAFRRSALRFSQMDRRAWTLQQIMDAHVQLEGIKRDCLKYMLRTCLVAFSAVKVSVLVDPIDGSPLVLGVLRVVLCVAQFFVILGFDDRADFEIK